MKSKPWLWEAIIYQVLIDRFFPGGRGGRRDAVSSSDGRIPPAFCGGNLQGVVEKLNYLADLGINTLWLSPFNQTQSEAYHGYHVTDFFRVAEQFGGPAGFKALIKTARARGIRLIMDFVPNHVSREHPWFVKAKNRRDPHHDWFYWRPHGDYLKYFDVAELPKLNLDHPAARAEIIRAAKYWLDQGVDGFRLDHAIGPSLDFWRAFRTALKGHNPAVVLIGEVAFGGLREPWLETIQLPNKEFYFAADAGGLDVMDDTLREYVEVFDGLLDFQFHKILNALVAHARRPLPTTAIQALLDRHYAGFPTDCCLLSFLDNHDKNRFLFEAGQDKERLQRAAQIQFAQRHPPVIYYGTELGMSQSRPIMATEPYSDQQARRLMAWEWGDPGILDFYKRLIQDRKSPRGRAPA